MGVEFNTGLNADVQKIKTPARYDSNAGTWLMDSANYIKNASGVWVPVSDTDPMPTKLTGSNALNKETLSVSGSAIGFAAIPSGTRKAFVTTEAADIRFWVNGSNPTITQGHLVKAGGAFELDSADQITNFKAIAVSGTATLQVSYF